MIKDKISTVISKPKLSISSSKMSLNAIKRFSILTIDNKYIKNTHIIQFLLRTLVNNEGILNYFVLLKNGKSWS